MAKVKIGVYKNNNLKSLAYGKYYGCVNHTSAIDSTTLCKHAAMDSGIEESQVALIYDAQLKQMKEQLCNGHPIVVPELGTFKLGISSEGVSLADVRKRHPEFDPETEDIRKYLSAKQVKDVYILFTPCDSIKESLRGIKLETDKTIWQAQIENEKKNV